MIQANLCDAVVLACNRANTAVTLALVGPLDKDKKPVELASLSGLTGSARLQAGFSRALIPKPKSTRRLAAQAKEFPLAILATIAQPTFGFREPATLTDHEPSYVTWGVTAQLSLKTTTWAALGSYAYEDTRKPNDPANICTPSSLGPPGTLACSSVTFGEPEREYKRIITGEVRRLIGNMAILHLLLSHDYNAGVTGVELPIYIIPKLQDGLGGGVRIGYRTDEKHLTAAIFVGVMKL